MVCFRLPLPIKTLVSGHGRRLVKPGLWVRVLSELFCINIFFPLFFLVTIMLSICDFDHISS